MSADTSSRTLVLSVVAVDLVGYSRKSVAEQMSLKDNFNRVLLEAISNLSVADRIILDTGDGVAIGFMGDPEDALYVAMYMRDAIDRSGATLSTGAARGEGSGKSIRIGINLGPVKLATGVGGHPNIIGDGINVAERIMTFAEPGQLTASRPFFEIMSRMSNHYATLFQNAGVRTDKQVRTHDVYLVGKSSAAFLQAEQGVAERAAQRGTPVAAKLQAPATPPVRKPVKPEADSIMATAAPVERHPALIDFLEDRKKVATSATLLAVVALSLGGVLVYRKLLLNPPAAGAVPVIAAAAPSQAATEKNAAVSVPSSAPAITANVAGNTTPVKTEAKPVTPTPANAPPVAVAAKPAATAAVVPAPAPGAAPAKSSERTAPPAAAAAVNPALPRDKPKDAKVDSTTRDDTRNDPRKTSPARPPAERPQSAPLTAAPVVPSYQSPVQALQPGAVAPTPSLPPPPVVAPRIETGTVIVSRSEPAYPVEGIRQGILRLVVVKARVTIDAAGNVGDVVVLEGGPIAAFARETRNTLKQWKFNPGAPGRTQDVEITFKP
jgi:TonB family protein